MAIVIDIFDGVNVDLEGHNAASSTEAMLCGGVENLKINGKSIPEKLKSSLKAESDMSAYMSYFGLIAPGNATGLRVTLGFDAQKNDEQDCANDLITQIKNSREKKVELEGEFFIYFLPDEKKVIKKDIKGFIKGGKNGLTMSYVGSKTVRDREVAFWEISFYLSEKVDLDVNYGGTLNDVLPLLAPFES